MYRNLLTLFRSLPGRRYRDKVLRNLIQGRKVLILGSGPSVKDLRAIPKDVLVFSCNFGPQALLEKGLEPKVDLYICTRQILVDKEYLHRIETLLENVSIDVFIFKKPSFLKNTAITNYEELFYNDTADDRFLKKLVPSASIHTEILSHGKISNGMRLLQYALFYDAKEIYLAGVDLHGKGYGIKNNDDNSVYETAHKDADMLLSASLAAHHGNIYTAVTSSPLVDTFPRKELGA